MKTTLYMLNEQSSTQMMAYVLQTKEGHLVVIDGGNKADAQHLQDVLIKLGGPHPVVDLWLLTHPHRDHVDALLEIFSHPNPLQVKKVYSRFLSYEFYQENAYQGDDCPETQRRFTEFAAAHPDICFTFGKGQRFQVGSVEITVLHVPDESIPENVCNNSSVVFRVDTEGQRLLFIGDLGEEAGDRVLETVPQDELKADFVQMAHHGQNGVKKNFYQAVSPKVCLWNTPKWLWDNDQGKGYGTGPWRTIEVQGWMKELRVGHHFVTKDGEQVFPFPYPLD